MASETTASQRKGRRHGSKANNPSYKPTKSGPSRTLTCANCRTRKTRCDGTQPGCKTCEVYKDECRYERPPPMSQIIAMAKRLQECETTIEDLKQNASLGNSSRSDASGLESLLDDKIESNHGTPLNTNYVRSDDGLDMPPKDSKPEILLSDLSLDENGQICYIGPTSAVHDPPSLQGQRSVKQHNDSKGDARTMLTSNAMQSRAWEEFALGNAAFECDIPHDSMSTLLQIHWAWIAPMFMWVYRPAFMRDMATKGPYFSKFLLTVLCGHSARFHETHIGDLLISRARLLLGTEIHKPSSIPVVQGLLQLSARDLAYGSISQAWLYSGMAFRMVSDLGLHHSSGKALDLGHLTVEDMEIRRRLFWSCYFWDKAISLYMGRIPTLTELPFDHAPELLDDFAEHELWTPYYGTSSTLAVVSATAYPPMKSHNISCFENSCKIAIILSDIILQLYSRRAPSDFDVVLRRIRAKLDDWRANSPQHLVYDPDNLPDISPPPHILTQNLLFYTTNILLHRPFYSSEIHHTICRKAADNSAKLLLLLEKTFGFTRITYLIAYCIYTAASTMIQDVKNGDLEASANMDTFLRALKGGRTTCPVVQRSLDIINSSLRKPLVEQLSSIHDVDDGLTRNYLPAFPYRDPDIENTNLGNFGNPELDAFSLLDCFPENHMMEGSSEWFMQQ